MVQVWETRRVESSSTWAEAVPEEELGGKS